MKGLIKLPPQPPIPGMELHPCGTTLIPEWLAPEDLKAVESSKDKIATLKAICQRQAKALGVELDMAKLERSVRCRFREFEGKVPYVDLWGNITSEMVHGGLPFALAYKKE